MTPEIEAQLKAFLTDAQIERLKKEIEAKKAQQDGK